MPKVLECPNCGAPLEPDVRAGAIECAYCERHVVVADGTLTKAPAAAVARSPEAAAAKRPPSERKKTERKVSGLWARKESRRVVLFVLGGLVLAAAMVVGPRLMRRDAGGPQAKSESLLRDLSLTTTPDEIKARFAEQWHPNSRPTNITLDFRLGVVRRAELRQDIPGEQVISHATLWLNELDVAAAVAKIEQIVPNRGRKQAAGHRFHVGDVVLDVSATNVSVWHWSSVHTPNADYASCKERLEAFWALARWAVLDGPALDDRQRKLVNGPSIAEVAAIDTTPTIEGAVDAFRKQFPAGWCRTQAGLLCVADVDDPLVTEIRFGWPNGLRARIHEMRFVFESSADAAKAQRAIAGCLQVVLGAGEETITDYVRDTRTWRWTPATEEAIVLGPGELSLSSSAPVDQETSWSKRIAEIAAAVDRCPV